jgi:hypothetical protein
MATAGRILIMPKGAYNASVTYEMLDMVSHNNQTWLAKKTCVGIEPSASNADYWFCMVGISAADLATLKTEIIADAVSKDSALKQEILAMAADLLNKSGGEMRGVLKAVNPDASVEGVRNIKAGTADLTAGSSALTTGSVYIVYE